MNYVFEKGAPIVVPDGTIVYPFLNSKDSKSNLPWNRTDNISFAVGDIAPHSQSKIHVHPFLVLITLVVSGTLQIKMKDPDHEAPYVVPLNPEQAALTNPLTFLQHINSTGTVCRVFYIVSPAYVFLTDDNRRVVYDDAIVTDLDWVELAKQQWHIPALDDIGQIRTARDDALSRLYAQKFATDQN